MQFITMMLSDDPLVQKEIKSVLKPRPSTYLTRRVTAASAIRTSSSDGTSLLFKPQKSKSCSSWSGDTSGGGELEFDEFVRCSPDHEPDEPDPASSRRFAKCSIFDPDGDGTITSEVFQVLELMCDDAVSQEEITRIVTLCEMTAARSTSGSLRA